MADAPDLGFEFNLTASIVSCTIATISRLFNANLTEMLPIETDAANRTAKVREKSMVGLGPNP